MSFPEYTYAHFISYFCIFSKNILGLIHSGKKQNFNIEYGILRSFKSGMFLNKSTHCGGFTFIQALWRGGVPLPNRLESGICLMEDRKIDRFITPKPAQYILVYE